MVAVVLHSLRPSVTVWTRMNWTSKTATTFYDQTHIPAVKYFVVAGESFLLHVRREWFPV
jgi:hypothetical protein